MMDSLNVPLTLEGSFALHQMARIRWPEWKRLDPAVRADIASEAASLVENMGPANSAVFSLLGHKGDLMFLHFRRSMDQLNQAELDLARLRLWDYLELTTSYVSVVELGLYDSTARMWRTFQEQGLKPASEEWKKAQEEEIERQRKAMEPRLYPAIPAHRFACFYPMDRKRGEEKNWYQVPFHDRNRMMHEHGQVGRRYAEVVRQIITGSIGFDDWEWGVDLFSEDPLWFKKLIYEMRFDEVSAVYALFGTFYVGVRTLPAQLAALLEGQAPER
ncbi:MAG: heme-dependent peroxidase [Acidobacteria bacterium]|nr:heme-dependent peroxidase [Acidobacteriota bacterium]